MSKDFRKIAKVAKQASLEIADISTKLKNEALNKIAEMFELHKEEIFDANRIDLEEAEELLAKGEITKSTFNRLRLDEFKMRDMIQGVRDIASLDDPVGKKLLERELDKDLTLCKVSCPIGVLGIIFEARPNVTSDAAVLCLKAGNAVILRGGK